MDWRGRGLGLGAAVGVEEMGPRKVMWVSSEPEVFVVARLLLLLLLSIEVVTVDFSWSWGWSCAVAPSRMMKFWICSWIREARSGLMTTSL